MSCAKPAGNDMCILASFGKRPDGSSIFWVLQLYIFYVLIVCVCIGLYLSVFLYICMYLGISGCIRMFVSASVCICLYLVYLSVCV